MNQDPSVDAIAALLQSDGVIEPPRVTELVSVIRSGEQFVLGPSSPGPTVGQTTLFIGPLVIEWGFDVEDSKAQQFRRWLQDNEAALANAVPTGVQYRGTYAVFASAHPSLGAYRTIWALDTLDALNSFYGECSQTGSQFGRLVLELNSFRDRRIGAGRGQQIYQPAAQALRI